MKPDPRLIFNITALSLAACAIPGHRASAADYTWGGGSLDWSDTSALGWNGGPPSSGDNATIQNGIVTLTTNNLVNPLASITLGGTGKLTQTTGNTWSAFNNLILSGGTLESTRSSGDAFGAYQLSNTVTVTGSGPSALSTNGGGSVFINLGQAVSDSLTVTTFNVNDVTASSATDLSVSTVLANNIATNFASFSAAGLAKSGAGTMSLSANNSYTGGTTVNGGVLEIAGSSAGNGHIRGNVTVNSGAELRYTGGDGTGFGFNGGNKLDTININGGLVNSQGGMTHLWGASVNMTGGELRVNNGTSSPTGLRIEWNQSTVNTLASASSAIVSGRINLRDDGGYTSAVFNVADGSAASDLLVSAAITESGSVGITKNGAGTMELTGSNSYTGATLVTAGKLTVNGNISTSVTTVQSGGTLGGSGTVGSLIVQAGATVTPGNSSGVLTVDGDYTHAGTLALEINGLSAGSLHDQIIVDRSAGDGSLSLSGNLSVLFGGGYVPANGDLIFILLNDGTDAVTGTFSGLAQNDIVTTYGGFDWRISYSADASGSSFLGGNDIALVAVPEPGSILLGGLGMLALLRRRR